MHLMEESQVQASATLQNGGSWLFAGGIPKEDLGFGGEEFSSFGFQVFTLLAFENSNKVTPSWIFAVLGLENSKTVNPLLEGKGFGGVPFASF